MDILGGEAAGGDLRFSLAVTADLFPVLCSSNGPISGAGPLNKWPRQLLSPAQSYAHVH
jgi:hypothetical protein